MRGGPRAGDYVVMYGQFVQASPRLELRRLAADGRDTLIRSTLESAAAAGPRFETRARELARESGGSAWRAFNDGVHHRIYPAPDGEHA